MAGSYSAVVDGLRRTFRTEKTRDVEFRRQQLRQLKLLLTEGRDALCQAVWKDIRRCANEAFALEINMTVSEIDQMVQHLAAWAKPERVRRGFTSILDDTLVLREPLGVVLVISPWNYPIHLAFLPLAAAIAAGNCVILKPSEVASHTAAVVEELIKKYLDPTVVKVVTGGPAETTELLKERFDHILYTGGPAVAKMVMAAAAPHLTPVTLELGGKSPVVIDANMSPAALDLAVKRMTWGKFLSAGQTCLAPDYILCPPKLKSALISGIKKNVQIFYGKNAKESPDYSRMVADRHFDRLASLLEGVKVVYGGNTDRTERYIEPTVLEDVQLTDPIMQAEVFGPIFPILTYNTVEEAIKIINDFEKPLAMYVFSEDSKFVKKVLSSTSSGGVTVNDCLLHAAVSTLPFGGVGYSGMGRYHGKASFDTFSNTRSILYRNYFFELLLSCRYPPFSPRKQYWLEVLTTFIPLPTVGDFLRIFVPFLCFAIGIALGRSAWGS